MCKGHGLVYLLLLQADRMSSEIDPIEPFTCPESAGWDGQTLENFVDAHTWTVGMFFSSFLSL